MSTSTTYITTFTMDSFKCTICGNFFTDTDHHECQLEQKQKMIEMSQTSGPMSPAPPALPQTPAPPATNSGDNNGLDTDASVEYRQYNSNHNSDHFDIDQNIDQDAYESEIRKDWPIPRCPDCGRWFDNYEQSGCMECGYRWFKID